MVLVRSMDGKFASAPQLLCAKSAQDISDHVSCQYRYIGERDPGLIVNIELVSAQRDRRRNHDKENKIEHHCRDEPEQRDAESFKE